jgi:hypothetical protein
MPNVTVAWTLPTTRLSGKPLAVEQIRGVSIEISADGHCTVDMVVAEQSAQEIGEVFGHFKRLLGNVSRQAADQIVAVTGLDWPYWLGYHEGSRAKAELMSGMICVRQPEEP